MNAYRRAGSRETVLICVAVVILLTAGVAYWARSGGERVPAGTDDGIAFKCEACGARFHVSAREAERLLPVARGPRAAVESGGLTCPQCHEKRAFPESEASPG